MDYKVRKFEDSDYEFVYDLRKKAYQKYVEEHYGK